MRRRGRKTTEVTVSVAAGTAVAGTDYTAVSGVTLTIDAGETRGTETFTLALLDDDVDEPDETVTVTGATTARRPRRQAAGRPDADDHRRRGGAHRHAGADPGLDLRGEAARAR